MKVCVYGAGAIGCYLGGRLLATGNRVVFVGRPSVTETLQQEGLRLSSYKGEHWTLPPGQVDCSTLPTAAAGADLVLVTVKSAATITVAAELAAVLKPGTVVISFQNGLSNADQLRQALPGHTVLAGMVPFNVAGTGPGRYHQGTEGELHVQEHARLAPFLPSFARAGLALQAHEAMLPVQWAKLLLNLNNPVNALSGLPLQGQLSLRAYRRCLALAQAEALDLLAAAGIQPARLTPLPAAWIPRLLGVPDPVFRVLGGRMLAMDPQARSSMADDLRAGRPTEIDWINGEVLRLAERLGRRAPVNARLCALVHAAETTPGASWSGEALLAELRRAR